MIPFIPGVFPPPRGNPMKDFDGHPILPLPMGIAIAIVLALGTPLLIGWIF